MRKGVPLINGEGDPELSKPAMKKTGGAKGKYTMRKMSTADAGGKDDSNWVKN